MHLLKTMLEWQYVFECFNMQSMNESPKRCHLLFRNNGRILCSEREKVHHHNVVQFYCTPNVYVLLFLERK